METYMETTSFLILGKEKALAVQFSANAFFSFDSTIITQIT